MNHIFSILTFILTILISTSTLYSGDNQYTETSHEIITQFKKLTKSSTWKLTDTIEQKFNTFHPQGMVKIGDFFYLTAVEVTSKPRKFDSPQNGLDRTPGTGIGHLFKIDLKGNLIDQITVGEGTIYHPGGIDYDGKYIWCPVAEYRRNSASIIYRINPDNLEAQQMFRFDDHIGAVVFNRTNNTLHGMSWGSRKFYTWKLDYLSGTLPSNEIPEYEMKLNGHHYIDYQDCHYAARNYMLCSGLSHCTLPNTGRISLGGIELVDLEQQVAIHQIPVKLLVKPDLVMTNNPFFFELVDDHLRFYFMPEDNKSKLYIYDVSNPD